MGPQIVGVIQLIMVTLPFVLLVLIATGVISFMKRQKRMEQNLAELIHEIKEIKTLLKKEHN